MSFPELDFIKVHFMRVPTLELSLAGFILAFKTTDTTRRLLNVTQRSYDLHLV